MRVGSLMYGCVVVFMIACASMNAQVFINEIVSKNNTSLTIDGKSPDWIELYNSSDQDVNLAGHFLTENKEQVDKWQFPELVIPANSYLILLADGQDIVDEFIHTNFKISSLGETLVFSDPSGSLISTIEIPPLETDISYSFVNSDWLIKNPTPGEDNSRAQLEKLASPIFNFTTGIYDAEINLNISGDSGTDLIMYEQTLDNLSQHVESFKKSINVSSHICAQATKLGFENSDITCHTFIISTDHELPILSVIGSEKEFFDAEKGLFELGPDAQTFWPYFGANFWKDEDSEVYFQYFNDGNNLPFHGHADLEMHGGRESRTQPQKTFRLLAKNKYGQAFFTYPFFDEKPLIDTFKRLVIRNGSGDYAGAHLRDGFLQSHLIRSNLNIDANANQPIAVYLNGEYYGLMGLREKMDKYYTKSNYNTTDVDLLEGEIVVIEGDSTKFLEDYDTVFRKELDDIAYKDVQNRFDVQNITDYFHAQLGNVSTAWPQNNIKFWRAKNDEARWRYLLFDMDIALGRHPWTLADENSLLNKMTSFGDQNTFINVINSLLTNASFYNQFMNRHQDLFNTVMSSDSMLFALETYVNQIDSEMMRHFNRWPDLTYEDWKSQEIKKIEEFMQDRPFFAAKYMDEFFDLGGIYNLTINEDIAGAATYKLNSLANLNAGFSGAYFKNIPISLSLSPRPSLFFKHWEISNKDGISIIRNTEINTRFQNDTEVKAIFSDTAPIEWVSSVTLDSRIVKLVLHNTSTESIQYDFYDVAGQKIISGEIQQPFIGTQTYDLPFNIDVSGIVVLSIRQSDNYYSTKLATF